MFSVAVIGCHGYAGQTLLALGNTHPEIRCVAVEDARSALDAGEIPEVAAAADVVALALPAEPAAAWASLLLQSGVRRILDLSDARRRDEEIHYALRELHGPVPRDATIVANPGCYPTATLLGLRPLVAAGLVDDAGVCVVGSSGATGAGKGLREDLHFCHLDSNVAPYKVGEHRHRPEIEHHLGTPVSLVTQLLPLSRGLTTTSFVRPRPGVRPEDLRGCLAEHYGERPYVHVLPVPDARLGLRQVVGSHDAAVAVGPAAHGGHVPVIATIDNLMRGAASQALVALNDWLGLDPYLGLAPPRDLHGALHPMFAHAQV